MSAQTPKKRSGERPVLLLNKCPHGGGLNNELLCSECAERLEEEWERAYIGPKERAEERLTYTESLEFQMIMFRMAWLRLLRVVATELGMFKLLDWLTKKLDQLRS